MAPVENSEPLMDAKQILAKMTQLGFKQTEKGVLSLLIEFDTKAQGPHGFLGILEPEFPPFLRFATTPQPVPVPADRLDTTAVKNMMTDMGYQVSDAEVRALVQEFDKEQTGTLHRTQFARVLRFFDAQKGQPRGVHAASPAAVPGMPTAMADDMPTALAADVPTAAGTTVEMPTAMAAYAPPSSSAFSDRAVPTPTSKHQESRGATHNRLTAITNRNIAGKRFGGQRRVLSTQAFDRDGDGVLDREEASALRANRRFVQFDTNGDQELDR